MTAEIEEVIELTRKLRLPYLRGELPEVLNTAKAQRWPPVEVLRVLLSSEVQGRHHSMIETRRKRARLPSGKTFDSFDTTRSSIALATINGLRTLEWIERHENLVVCGPSGTGKSHFLEALGHEAIDAGKVVAWCSVEELGGLVKSHRIDDSVPAAIRPILRADLVVVDDVGLLPLSADAAEGLFRLVDGAYEVRSIALSSNLHPSVFDELMGRTISSALVDRLLHHAHVVVTSGESIRLQDATAGRGVRPLEHR